MRRLYRSEKDKMVAGVCSGLAQYFDVDVLVIRLAAVALTISQFYLGAVAYALAAMVMPIRAMEDRPEWASPWRGKGRRQGNLGLRPYCSGGSALDD